MKMNFFPGALQWFKEGVRIPGATRSYLLIDKATRQDGGIYFCRLTNIVTSKDSTKVYLIVTVPPTTEGRKGEQMKSSRSLKWLRLSTDYDGRAYYRRSDDRSDDCSLHRND